VHISGHQIGAFSQRLNNTAMVSLRFDEALRFEDREQHSERLGHVVSIRCGKRG
jgi:hypothetical protein